MTSATLTATAAQVLPCEPLPVTIRISHDQAEPLAGLAAELTLEVERGVLMTWNLTLEPAASGEAARFASDPEFRLPLNVGAGPGRFGLILWDAAGALVSETTLELPVSAE